MAITVGPRFLPFSQQMAKTTSYTITAADNGTLFTTAGATTGINFTLPSLAPNLVYYFFNAADFTMGIASPSAGVVVAFNTIAAQAVAFSSTTTLLGASAIAYSLNDGTKWYVHGLGRSPVGTA